MDFDFFIHSYFHHLHKRRTGGHFAFFSQMFFFGGGGFPMWVSAPKILMNPVDDIYLKYNLYIPPHPALDGFY